MFKKYLINYFNFSKKELNGLLILVLLIVVMLFIPFLYQAEIISDSVDITRFKKEIREFEQSGQSERSYSYRDVKINADEMPVKAIYFNFDPNGLAESEWKKLGLSEKQIKVLKNYESKGGKFYRKEDLKKMYVISPELYQKLEPYIRIDQAALKYNSSQPAARNEASRLVSIDINLADSVELQKINGIGPAFASRIIRFRDRLGGFYKKEQLKEVYGVDSIKFVQWSPQIKISTTNIKRININTAVFEDLKRHPYLNFKQINAIIQYRKQHGEFQNLNDLRKIVLLNDEILRKLEPYLIF